MRILVTGGTGFIGRHIVYALHNAGHQPVARSRHTEPPLDFTRATTVADWLPHLEGVEAVVNAVGVLRDTQAQPMGLLHEAAPRALFDACAQADVRRVVQISALGIAGSATAYASSKRAADEHLLALTAAGQLDGLVLRPSMVFGAHGQSSQLFLTLARLPVLLLPQPMLQAQVQPVAVRDLADAVVQLLPQPGRNGLLELGGARALSLADLVASLRQQMDHQPAQVWPLPDWATQASARAGDWLPASPWCSDTLAMLAADNTTDSTALAEALGRPPLAPEQLYASLHTPASAR